MVGQTGEDDAKATLGRTVGSIGRVLRGSSAQLVGQLGGLSSSAAESAERLIEKAPDPYEEAIAAYNGAFTSMSDKGVALLRQRERAADLIQLTEELINSIAHTPKSFHADVEAMEFHRARFVAAEQFAQDDVEAARRSAVGTGAGFAAGAAVASMAPTAAIWVATTFGTASTGTAISTLSGAAASNAALAWLGGGAVAAGGGGTAAGSALLALAGPIGWTVAGATVLTSIALFARKKHTTREARREALASVEQNTATVRMIDTQLEDILQRTALLREQLMTSYRRAVRFTDADFLALPHEQQARLAALVNSAKACAVLLGARVDPEPTGDG
ncbi:hypothetical protein BCY76_007175 [Nesterenkonia sp. PF2B19]|nr:hypothetical protein BCY76_007175 [Nesterenkonia sp. PF2B19]